MRSYQHCNHTNITTHNQPVSGDKKVLESPNVKASNWETGKSDNIVLSSCCFIKSHRAVWWHEPSTDNIRYI